MQDIDSVAIEKIRVAAGDKAKIIVARNEHEVITAAPEAAIIFGRITEEIFAATILTPLALLLGETGVEKALLISSVLLVLIVELINSSIETTIDRIGLERNDLSKHAKDMASGAVFISLLNLLMIWYLVIAH